MPNPRVLLLDHPSPSAHRLVQALEREGFEVAHLEEREQALRLLREERVQVVLGEMGLGGEDILSEALLAPEGPPVILFDDFASVAEAFEAIRRGAFDLLSRPVTDEQVLLTVRRALEHRSLREENRRLRGGAGELFELGGLVSRDPRMGLIFDTVGSVADSRVGILIQGESGTGKTVLARTIHERSARANAPFVVVNCGALPGSLLESDLFGHTRGAFTGAVRDRQGKFAAADGGTIFLDEVSTASPELQVKLLRVIEEGHFERVGESRTRAVDVRILAATNCDLLEEVEAGRFRADLYYRLHVVAIDVPPLRKRVSDIPLLANRCLARFARRHGRDVRGIEPETMARLCAHPWPGNVRELENTLERGVLLARGPELTAHDLFPGESGDAASDAAADDPPRLEDLPVGPLKRTLEVPERWLVLRALRHHGGNRQATARALGINRTTLFNKMRRYNLLSFPTRRSGGDERGATAGE